MDIALWLCHQGDIKSPCVGDGLMPLQLLIGTVDQHQFVYIGHSGHMGRDIEASGSNRKWLGI